MYLERLSVFQFRNLDHISIRPDARYNLLYGCNGQGKTNILEAIYLLGNLRSFRNSKASDCICHGKPMAHISGTVVSHSASSTVRLTLERNGKKLLLDDKPVHRASDIHGKINAVVFSPDDTTMVKLGPETRRRYLDRVVYSSSIRYLNYWHDYHRTLKHRNQLLKQQQAAGLSVWTEKLAESAAHVVFERKQYVDQLNTKLRRHYAIISGNQEPVTIAYRPYGLHAETVSGLQEELVSQLESNLTSDQKYGTTSVGPHRDDVLFLIGDVPLKCFASQGEQKSFVLALKMAEMEHSELLYGEPPLLLLDDMSSELDAGRTRNLIDFICERQMQVFITTTDRSAVNPDMLPDCAVFHVTAGTMNFEGNEKL